jgi:chromosome segregation ATPase
MANNQPPPNATNAAVLMAEAPPLERPPLASLNGNCSRLLGAKPAKVKKIEATLLLERQKSKTALKDLADLESKLAKLGELSDKRGLKVSELQIQIKADKKAAVADLSLQKKIHKKELKVENDLAGSKVKAQINITKDVESTKRSLQKKLDAQDRTLALLQKAFAESKRRSSELSGDIMAVSKAKDSLKEQVRVLTRTIKQLTSKVDDQQVHKNAHELEMQRMKNQHKKMGLDELCKKLDNKKASGGTSSGPMSLEEKMDFVSHQAMVKQQGKDADLARAFQQKQIKRKENQTNLGYAARMLHSTSNLNGGAWSSTMVGDVS